MNILILTQPLLNNYGGLLQNYALQGILRRLGNDSVTFDMVIPHRLWKYIFSYIKTFILFFIPGKRRPFVKFKRPPRRKILLNNFVLSNLNTTKPSSKFSKSLVYHNDIDAIIVGSDQVWRPRYNYSLEDMYLKFAKNIPIKRIAYAASFGVDDWEYTPRQTRKCSRLVKKFDAISVREETGVRLCKENLGVEATWVLDPTLLLTKEDYLPICDEVPVCDEKYLAVYVLDENEEMAATYEKEAASHGLVIRKIHVNSKNTLTIPEWLAMFRDASYVVTDSFHGTVFSIIFEKDFKCIFNNKRGTARFESLLKLYNSGKLEEMRQFSINWLKKALET